MRIRMQDGRDFEGTPIEIVKGMKDISFGVDQMSLSEYIDSVEAGARKFELVELGVTGSTEVEKAASLVDRMLAAGLCVELE